MRNLKTSLQSVRQSVLKHPKVRAWIVDPLSRDVALRLLALADEPDIQHMAIMPDVHLAGDYCVGTVLATRNLIYPDAIGGDIGCGMAAIELNANVDLLRDSDCAANVLNRLRSCVPGLRRGASERITVPESLSQMALSDPKLDKVFHREGVAQLGTLGRGNHFLEFQSDAQGGLWLMVHSGSRGMGQAISSFHQRACQPGRFVTIEADSDVGIRLLHDYQWATEYAAANRRGILFEVINMIRSLFGISCDGSSLIESDHNHIRRESIAIGADLGTEYWVHRKGAQSAQLGQFGLIPGSMATSSYHVEGRGESLSLHSCSHGAGRTMSRKQATQRITKKQLLREMRDVAFDSRRAYQLLDESPAAYRDIRKVVKSQRELVRVVRRLEPVLSFKV